MAKPKIPNQKKKYQELNNRLNRYVALVEQIYDTLNLEVAKVTLNTEYDADSGTVFKFSDYPQTNKAIADIQAQFVNDIHAVIYRGTSDEWKNSNEVQDLMADKVLKAYTSTIDKQKYKVLYQANSGVLKAFQNRKDRGLNVSAKLWQQSTIYKEELEAAISCAIQKGASAITLSKQISKYLLDFPSLQKDYKEKYGSAEHLKDCEYRSIRLARSEINMAYRTAENERWKQMDFVVGYEIKLSGSHHHRMPHGDICDVLAGKYPKDFIWTGWHPNDLCYKIPILKTYEEFWQWDERSEFTTNSVNEVKDVPGGFKKWCIDNKPRIDTEKKNGTLPYFLKDNKSRIDSLTNSILIPRELAVDYKLFSAYSIINNGGCYSDIKNIYSKRDAAEWYTSSMRREFKSKHGFVGAEEELKAFDDYVWSPKNEGLRDGKISDELRKRNKLIDSLIKKNTLKEDVVVFRGTQSHAYDNTSYVSTSMNPLTAASFVEKKGSRNALKAYILPKGTHCYFNSSEGELLLPIGFDLKKAEVVLKKK